MQKEILNLSHDEKGNIIYNGRTIELSGKQYNLLDYVTNLAKYNTGEVKDFKLAYNNVFSKKTHTNKDYAEQAVEILYNELQDEQKVAIVMDYIIKNNDKKILADFKKIYDTSYKQYLSKDIEKGIFKSKYKPKGPSIYDMNR